jgi:hypothetical protein
VGGLRDAGFRSGTSGRARLAAWYAVAGWLGGLSENALTEAEAKWGVVFPAEYRLFLSVLHAVDTPMKHAHFRNGPLTIADGPAFYR